MKKTYAPQYYRDYLQLDKVLDAQHPKSTDYGVHAHDELLFIITHQAYELWFKQILHEMTSIQELLSQRPVPEHHIGTALFRVQRINRICGLLLDQISVLETMTPLDFLDFREFLSPASGFQSLQFRMVEILLGLENVQRLNIGRDHFYSRLDEKDRAKVEQVEQTTSLYTLVEQWLERMPFTDMGDYAFWEEYRKTVLSSLEGDRETLRSNAENEEQIAPQIAQIDATEQSFQALFDEEEYKRLQEQKVRRLSLKATQAALFIYLYRDYPLLQQPFRFLDALIEMDENLALWRYRHALMVSRMIGSKVGTGGSMGHKYLVETSVQHRVFKEFADLTSYLLPRREIPALPTNVQEQLQFSFEA